MGAEINNQQKLYEQINSRFEENPDSLDLTHVDALAGMLEWIPDDNKLAQKINVLQISIRQEITKREAESIQGAVFYKFDNPGTIEVRDLRIFMQQNSKKIEDASSVHVKIHSYLSDERVLVWNDRSGSQIDASKFSTNGWTNPNVMAQELANWINNLHAYNPNIPQITVKKVKNPKAKTKTASVPSTTAAAPTWYTAPDTKPVAPGLAVTPVMRDAIAEQQKMIETYRSLWVDQLLKVYKWEKVDGLEINKTTWKVDKWLLLTIIWDKLIEEWSYIVFEKWTHVLKDSTWKTVEKYGKDLQDQMLMKILTASILQEKGLSSGNYMQMSLALLSVNNIWVKAHNGEKWRDYHRGDLSNVITKREILGSIEEQIKDAGNDPKKLQELHFLKNYITNQTVYQAREATVFTEVRMVTVQNAALNAANWATNWAVNPQAVRDAVSGKTPGWITWFLEWFGNSSAGSIALIAWIIMLFFDSTKSIWKGLVWAWLVAKIWPTALKSFDKNFWTNLNNMFGWGSTTNANPNGWYQPSSWGSWMPSFWDAPWVAEKVDWIAGKDEHKDVIKAMLNEYASQDSLKGVFEYNSELFDNSLAKISSTPEILGINLVDIDYSKITSNDDKSINLDWPEVKKLQPLLAVEWAWKKLTEKQLEALLTLLKSKADTWHNEDITIEDALKDKSLWEHTWDLASKVWGKIKEWFNAYQKLDSVDKIGVVSLPLLIVWGPIIWTIGAVWVWWAIWLNLGWADESVSRWIDSGGVIDYYNSFFDSEEAIKIKDTIRKWFDEEFTDKALKSRVLKMLRDSSIGMSEKVTKLRKVLKSKPRNLSSEKVKDYDRLEELSKNVELLHFTPIIKVYHENSAKTVENIEKHFPDNKVLWFENTIESLDELIKSIEDSPYPEVQKLAKWLDSKKIELENLKKVEEWKIQPEEAAEMAQLEETYNWLLGEQKWLEEELNNINTLISASKGELATINTRRVKNNDEKLAKEKDKARVGWELARMQKRKNDLPWLIAQKEWKATDHLKKMLPLIEKRDVDLLKDHDVKISNILWFINSSVTATDVLSDPQNQADILSAREYVKKIHEYWDISTYPDLNNAQNSIKSTLSRIDAQVDDMVKNYNQRIGQIVNKVPTIDLADWNKIDELNSFLSWWEKQKVWDVIDTFWGTSTISVWFSSNDNLNQALDVRFQNEMNALMWKRDFTQNDIVWFKNIKSASKRLGRSDSFSNVEQHLNALLEVKTWLQVTTDNNLVTLIDNLAVPVWDKIAFKTLSIWGLYSNPGIHSDVANYILKNYSLDGIKVPLAAAAPAPAAPAAALVPIHSGI